MNPRLKSDTLNLVSASLPLLKADSRPLTAYFAATIAAAHPPTPLLQNPLLCFLLAFLASVRSLPVGWRFVFVFLYSSYLGGSTAFVFCLYSVLGTQYSVLFLAPRSLMSAAFAQNAKAAAMTEPTASLGGSSRASRPPMTYIQRLLPSFPFVIAAAFPP